MWTYFMDAPLHLSVTQCPLYICPANMSVLTVSVLSCSLCFAIAAGAAIEGNEAILPKVHSYFRIMYFTI